MLISVQELAKYSSRQEMREGESLPPPARDKLKSGFYPFSHPPTLPPSQYMGTFSLQMGSGWKKDMTKPVKQQLSRINPKVCGSCDCHVIPHCC